MSSFDISQRWAKIGPNSLSLAIMGWIKSRSLVPVVGMDLEIMARLYSGRQDSTSGTIFKGPGV